MKIIGSKWQFLTLPNICHLHVYLVYTFICYLHPLCYKSGALDKAQRSFFFYICPFFFVNWPRGLESVFCSPLFCDHIFDTGTLLYGFFSLKGVLVIFESSLFSLPFFNINCYTHVRTYVRTYRTQDPHSTGCFPARKEIQCSVLRKHDLKARCRLLYQLQKCP